MLDLSRTDGFEWDMANVQKVSRRVDLQIVEAAFNEQPLFLPDEKHSTEDEQRYQLVSINVPRPIFVIFTLRQSKIRVISARYMHHQEVKKYEKK